MAQPQPYPTTFATLQEIVYPSCEDFIAAARRIAESESVSLTITHKSRNTPGKSATQYRGCVVLNCLQWENGCTFEIKAYGLVEGGWRMRPLQHPGLKKHTVTSWCICNHAKVPLRVVAPPQLSSWTELLALPFALPDDLIAAADHVAALNSISLYLLTLMISDGKPKPNGRNSTYVPRGFLTLECVEAENGCPFAIKAREETDGWYMRPWREKGKGDLKGAVSTIVCKHGLDVQTAYRAKQAEKERKLLENKSNVKNENGGGGDDLQEPDSPSHDIPSGLDPVLAHPPRAFEGNPPLSPTEILGVIEQQLGVTSPQYPPPPDGAFATNGYGPEHFQSSSMASTSAVIYPESPNHLDPFPPSLSYDPTQRLPTGSPSPALPSSTKRSSAPPSTSDSRAPKRVRTRAPGAPTGGKLKTSWKSFLAALDPLGRLSQLNQVLADGGIDPGAVVEWPEEDVREFVEQVGSEVPAGVKIHFRVLLNSEGKRVWGELVAKAQE